MTFQSFPILPHHLTITVSLARTTTPVEIPALTLSSSALPSVAVVSSAILTQSTSAASSASSSATLIPSGSSSSSHDSAKEGAAFGAPIAIPSVVIILLVAFLAQHKSWIQWRKANLLNQMLNSSSSAERSELPTDMVPMDMYVQKERWELEGHTGKQEQAP